LRTFWSFFNPNYNRDPWSDAGAPWWERGGFANNEEGLKYDPVCVAICEAAQQLEGLLGEVASQRLDSGLSAQDFTLLIDASAAGVLGLGAGGNVGAWVSGDGSYGTFTGYELGIGGQGYDVRLALGYADGVRGVEMSGQSSVYEGAFFAGGSLENGMLYNVYRLGVGSGAGGSMGAQRLHLIVTNRGDHEIFNILCGDIFCVSSNYILIEIF
jgi:hypothetical protein